MIEERCDSCGALDPGIEVAVADRWGSRYRMIDVCSYRCAVDLLTLEAARLELEATVIPPRPNEPEEQESPEEGTTELPSPRSPRPPPEHLTAKPPFMPPVPDTLRWLVLEFLFQRAKSTTIQEILDEAERQRVNPKSIPPTVARLSADGCIAKRGRGVYVYVMGAPPDMHKKHTNGVGPSHANGHGSG